MKKRHQKSGENFMSDAKVKLLSDRSGIKVSRIRKIEGKAIARLQQLTSKEKADLVAKFVPDYLVTFLPVVGDKYYSQGRRVLGRRVMIVGASHYCEHFESAIGCNALCEHFGKYYFACEGEKLYFGGRCERFSHVVLERYRKRIGKPSERRWFGTFSKFFNAFFPSPVPHEIRTALMNLIASAEYMQGAEGRGPNGKNREAMCADRNFETFKEMIAELKPEVIIFWGPRAWCEVCKRTDGAAEKDDILHVALNKHKVTLVRVPHPSSSAFKRDHFREQLECVGICADKLLKVTQQKG